MSAQSRGEQKAEVSNGLRRQRLESEKVKLSRTKGQYSSKKREPEGSEPKSTRNQSYRSLPTLNCTNTESDFKNLSREQ